MASEITKFISILTEFNAAFKNTKNGITAKVAGQTDFQLVKLFANSRPTATAQDSLEKLVAIKQEILNYFKSIAKPQQAPSAKQVLSRPPSSKDTKESSEVTQLKAKIKDLEQELAKSENHRKQLTVQNGNISHRLKGIEQENEKLQKKAQPQERPPSSSGLRTRIEEQDKTIRDLNDEVQKMKREKSILEKRTPETQDPNKLREAQDQSEKIKKQGEELESLKNQNASLKTKVDDLTNQLQIIKDELENAKQQSKKVPVAPPPSKENSDIKRKTSEIEALKQNNKAISTELEENKRKINELEQENNESNERTKQLQNELNKIDSSKKDTEKKLADARLEVKKCEEKLKRCDKEFVTRVDLVDQIKAVLKGNMPPKDVVDVLITKNAENIDRLAAEMNAKVAADESALENISIKCRPMNVAEDYNLLCSNAWLEAKNALDEDKVEEEKAARFLCTVMKVAEQEAGKAYNTFIDKLQNALDSKKPLPQNVITSVGDYLRATVANYKPEPLVSAVTKHLEQTSEYKRYTKHKDVQIFIKESAILAWKMVIQRPAMCFDTPGIDKPFKNEDIADLFWGSNPNNKGALLRYYVTPVLKHGDKPMAKGKVIVN